MLTALANRPIRLLAALLGALALIATACGDDDGGGGSALSEDEFCELMAEVDDDDLDFDDPEAFAIFGQIARQAPDAELRAALMTIAEAFEGLEGLDEDDPAAVLAVFALLGDAEFMAAGETVERYMEDVCGIETDGDFDTDFGDDDGFFGDDDDAFGDNGDDGGSSWAGGGSAMDELSAGDIREALGSAFDDYAPDNRGTGVGIWGNTVDATVYDAPDVDGVGLCQALAEVVASFTDDAADIRLEILSDDTLVAERNPGGSCVAA